MRSAQLSSAAAADGAAAAGEPTLFGVVLMSALGDTVWVGWANQVPSVPVTRLCQTISNFFKREGETQNSSYLDAGSFAAASTTDGDSIVTVVCSCSCSETEVRSTQPDAQ